MTKLPTLGSSAAVFDYARSGPHFGAAELVIGATLAPVMGGFTGNTGTIHMITHTRVCDDIIH